MNTNTNNTNKRRNFLSKMLITGVSGVTLLSTATYARGKKKTSTTPVLTEDQKDELFYIYQEEKLARDVYITLGNIYTNENTFASIQISEQRHLDSAKDLCKKYNVSIEGVNEKSIGNFVLPVLQELYDTLVEKGEKSLMEALEVGEYIEVTDIEDLEHAQVGMPSDVVQVFENLKEGSLSHLDAFQAAISRAS